VPIQLAHSAGSLGWPFPMLKYNYVIFFPIKRTEAIFFQTALGNCYGVEITKMLSAVFKINLLCYYNFRHTFVPYRGANRPSKLSRPVQITLALFE